MEAPKSKIAEKITTQAKKSKETPENDGGEMFGVFFMPFKFQRKFQFV